jgi:hypothetical protein
MFVSFKRWNLFTSWNIKINNLRIDMKFNKEATDNQILFAILFGLFCVAVVIIAILIN